MTLFHASIASLAIAMTGQGPIQRPTAAPTLSTGEMNRQLTDVAKSRRPLTFSTLFTMGILRVKNESASLAIVWPTWVDGYAQGWAEMNGTRGGANTTNEKQSVLDIRFSTNKPNVLHALVIPISRRPTDVQEARFEVKFGSETIQRTVVGNKMLMATFTPTRTGMHGLSVKMLSPGKYCFSDVHIKVANE